MIKRIVIVGVGGIGYWLAWCLSRDLSSMGITIEVYDPDDLQNGSGHRRLPKASRPDIKKVDFLMMQIRNIMGEASPIGHAKLLTPEEFRGGDWQHTLVIDCTDADMVSRREWYRKARLARAKVIRASYEGRTEQAGGLALVANDLPFQKSTDNGGGYNNTPSTSLSFMAAGLAGEMIQEMLKAGSIRDFQIELPVTWPVEPEVEPEIEIVSQDDEDEEDDEPTDFSCYNIDCENRVDGYGDLCGDCLEAESEEDD